jgi:acyl-CoA thioester hydrolase
MSNKNVFELILAVRDYECDLQGIVNNSVYMNYLEHTRHEFLKSVGLNFAQLHKEGKDAVVVRMELDFKSPLTSGDNFKVRLSVDKKGMFRFIFYQDIFRIADNKHILSAKAICACFQNKRPIVLKEIEPFITR